MSAIIKGCKFRNKSVTKSNWSYYVKSKKHILKEQQTKTNFEADIDPFVTCLSEKNK